MQAISAFRAEDGTLHPTRESAAIADLCALGFDMQAALDLIDKREQVENVLRQVSGLAHIPVYFPELPSEAA